MTSKGLVFEYMRIKEFEYIFTTNSKHKKNSNTTLSNKVDGSRPTTFARILVNDKQSHLWKMWCCDRYFNVCGQHSVDFHMDSDLTTVITTTTVSEVNQEFATKEIMSVHKQKMKTYTPTTPEMQAICK